MKQVKNYTNDGIDTYSFEQTLQTLCEIISKTACKSLRYLLNVIFGLPHDSPGLNCEASLTCITRRCSASVFISLNVPHLSQSTHRLPGLLPKSASFSAPALPSLSSRTRVQFARGSSKEGGYQFQFGARAGRFVIFRPPM